MDPSQYSGPPLAQDDQCIAPTKKAGRCQLKVSKADLSQALKLVTGLEDLVGEERMKYLERIILLHVCDNTHRVKLKAHETCLAKLVQNYADTLKTHTGNVERNPKPVESAFRPFTTNLKKDMQSLLTTKISPNEDPQGFLYGFRCVADPDFIKIGYAKTSPERRVKAWKKCHSEADIVFQVHFPFPKRMESLVHMQLINARYELIKPCEFCGTIHTEWFKLSVRHAKSLVEAWHKVVCEAPLYLANGNLTAYWVGTIRNMTTVTAASLLQSIESRRKLQETPHDRSTSAPDTEVIIKFKSEIVGYGKSNEIWQISNDLKRKLILPES